MNPKSLIIASCLITFGIATASAAPVTGWSVGLGTPVLSNAETSSPTMGDGTAENADNDAIHAAFPSITLAVGEKLIFSGSMQLSSGVGLAGSGGANEFRVGIFNHDGNPGITSWLGYYASNPSGTTGAGVRERSSAANAYYSQTGTSLFGTNNLVDTTKTFQDATYDFALSLERTESGISVGLVLENELGYSIIPATFEDTTPNTFTFDRVGFLAGNGLNADQIQFSNLDVTVVPEPSTIALAALGALAVVGYRFRRG